MAVYKPRRLRNETEPEQVREPSLYRSLCTSLLSTLLSLVMLVGTTFAWFTESITTGVYTITAGKLSTVTSCCKTWGDWKLLENGNTDLFSGMAFNAPDATQTAYLKLENESPNPVKYLISFLCDNETAGTLKKSVGTTTTTSEEKLSELMSFAYTVASDTNTGGTIPSFDPSTGHSIPLGQSADSPFSILVQGGSTVFVKLELELGNYEGTWTVEPKIDLQLKLVITQPDNNDSEENNTTSQALQAKTPVTVGEAATSEGANLTVGVTIENALEPPSPAGEPADKPIVEPAVEPVVGPAAEPSTETATAPAAEDTSSAETAQELSSAPETTE